MLFPGRSSNHLPKDHPNSAPSMASIRRKMDSGTSFYGIGGCVGLNPWGAEKPLGERIDKWRELGIEQRLYEKAFLSPSIPWNFLTSIQLSGRS